MPFPKKDLLKHVREQPFRPFRIVFNSGRHYDIRHPESIKVSQDVAVIFDPTERQGPFDDILDWHTVSLALIEHVEYLKDRSRQRPA